MSTPEVLAMRKFGCSKCGKEIESSPEAGCAPELLANENLPFCCGSPMNELMED